MQTVLSARPRSDHLASVLIKYYDTTMYCFVTRSKVEMMLQIYVFILIFMTSNAISISKVSENQTVTKREAKPGDFYPDWVPFKNKHGEQLGEFTQVELKPKPKKKRLAPPVNFILRAVAESEDDDYFDKGQGESDAEDYYEKKEWSDVNRPVKKNEVKEINHTELSDIDGVVDIITKTKPDPLLKAIHLKNKKKKAKKQTIKQENEEKVQDKEEKKVEEKIEDDKENQNFKSDTEDTENEDKGETKEEQITTTPKGDDEADYQESSEKKQTDAEEEERKTKEQKENEAKKAKILNSVDELKERHAEEQRLISEKVREEEEFERNKLQPEPTDKYGNDPYKPKKLLRPDYDEYNDKDSQSPIEEKYRPQRKSTTPKPTTTKSKIQLNNIKTGKISVFNNPSLYVAYDDQESETAAPMTTKRPKKSKKSKRPILAVSPPSADPIQEETVRISLVPKEIDGKADEPTLFFPKKRKHKSRRRFRSTTPATDSFVEETVEQETAKNFTKYKDKTEKPTALTTASDASVTAPDVTASDSLPTTVDIPASATTGFSADTSAPSAPSAQAASTIIQPVTDAVAASTDHKKEENKNEDYEHEKGGSRDFKSQHEEEHGEHGKKAYEGFHEDTKTSKGHHDKEDHLGKYDDEGGFNKEHHDEKAFYGDHHHEEQGKKHAKYEESGKHSKGHSTKGSHDIHKKEEYEKKVEFFEEDGDSSEEEKFGGHNEEHGHMSGGHFKKAKLDSDHDERHKGETGHFAKGGHVHVHKGHRQSAGHDSHGKRGGDSFHKEGQQSGKKWVYHHGSPAKTANLAFIDRRTDRFSHGPQYFG